MSDESQLKRDARLFLRGQERSIQIGRSRNSAGVTHHTRVEIVEGDQKPVLAGSPHLKTQFHNGNFSKTLYTPSTLHIVVGREWKQ